MSGVIQISYFVAAVLFILGLKRMSSPRTARSGVVWAGWGMVLAVLVSFVLPEVQGFANYGLIVLAMVLGGVIALRSGRRVDMTDMPQMIALYNGMGGGAAAAIAAVEWLNHGAHLSASVMSLTLAGAVIGTVSFSGSLIAYAKLAGILKRSWHLPEPRIVNIVLGLVVLLFVIWCGVDVFARIILLFMYLLLLVLGVVLTLPIGGANMPVVISLFNAMTGLAVGLEGFALDNPALMIAGTVVGAAGTLLTQLMAKAMNQSLLNILFPASSSSVAKTSQSTQGTTKPIEAADAAVMLAYAQRVIIVPGYGMAVAQAQHKLAELVAQLEQRDIVVKFAIHPVAGRMPGHMNVLLAEAGISYELIKDLDEVNPEFASTDVVVVIGANDVVNPVARTDPNSPIFGMPILNVDQAEHVLVVKRGQGKGFSGIENDLFYADRTRMLYGDGQAVMAELVQMIKTV